MPPGKLYSMSPPSTGTVTGISKCWHSEPSICAMLIHIVPFNPTKFPKAWSVEPAFQRGAEGRAIEDWVRVCRWNSGSLLTDQACICKHPTFLPCFSSHNCSVVSGCVVAPRCLWVWTYLYYCYSIFLSAISQDYPLLVSSLHQFGFYLEAYCFDGNFFHFFPLSSPQESLPWESKVSPPGELVLRILLLLYSWVRPASCNVHKMVLFLDPNRYCQYN